MARTEDEKKAYRKAYREAHKEKLNAYSRAYYHDNKEEKHTQFRAQYKKHYYKHREQILARRKIQHYRYKYDISLEELNALKDAQHGCCAVCHKPTEKLYVDHCHSSGQVRGMLCYHCNVMLGHVFDDIQILDNAIKYLDLYKQNRDEV